MVFESLYGAFGPVAAMKASGGELVVYMLISHEIF